MGKKKLNAQELEERIAVLKRFKALLQRQRDTFSEYLFVLEKQEEDISKDNMGHLISHNEVGNAIIQNILNIQKVIEPIEKMYGLLNSNNADSDVFTLKNDLKRLQNAVIKQNERNRLMLQEASIVLKKEIAEFPIKNKYKKNVYANNEELANYIDVSY